MADEKRFTNLHVLEHPLIQHKLTHARKRDTSVLVFRQLVREIAMLMGYEITRDLPVKPQAIETPLAPMLSPVLDGRKVAIVPILRAALGMADGLLELMPYAPVGHIGLYRDEDTKRPCRYLCKLPDPEGRLFIVVDPMLATGHTAVEALSMLNDNGVKDEQISFLSLVAAPEGMEVFSSAHPEVPVYVAALDDHLDEHAYIVPGLGDAGDRYFGTS